MTQKICVVGLGYIGLPTACTFAEAGFDVLGVDVNPEVVRTVSEGRCHLDEEPELSGLLAKVVRSGRLRAAAKPEPADFFVICVPTPFRDGHRSDLAYVEAATASIAPHFRSGGSVALESTSPPGTTRRIVARAVEDRGLKPGTDFHVAYCPERVLPGQILRELKTNARTVGGLTETCARKVGEFYKRIVDAPVIETSAEVAETVKLVENSYRDVNIAFANEVSMVCHELGIDSREVIRIANQHPRVKVLSPGPGVGGHCIAVDPWFLVEAAPEQARLIRTAREVNLAKTRHVIDRIKSLAGERMRRTGKFQTIALFGMSYKPNVADFRESPAVEICHQLGRELGNMAEVLAWDPFLRDSLAEQLGIRHSEKAPEPASDTLTVLLVRHAEFQGRAFDLDFSA